MDKYIDIADIAEWMDGTTRLSLFRLGYYVSVRLDIGDNRARSNVDLPTFLDAGCAFQYIELAIQAHKRENPEAPLTTAYQVGAAALTDWAAEAITAYKNHLLATAYCAMYELELAEMHPTAGIHIYCDTEGAVQPATWVPWSVVRSELERNHKFPQEAR